MNSRKPIENIRAVKTQKNHTTLGCLYQLISEHCRAREDRKSLIDAEIDQQQQNSN